MWIAKYFDGRELKQFGDGRESLFKDIELDKLKSFELRVNSKPYEVDLVNGSFMLEGVKIEFENFGSQNDFDLIYFKRVRNTIGQNSVRTETFCFGWKTNIDGHTFKRIVKISDGNIQLALK